MSNIIHIGACISRRGHAGNARGINILCMTRLVQLFARDEY